MKGEKRNFLYAGLVFGLTKTYGCSGLLSWGFLVFHLSGRK